MSARYSIGIDLGTTQSVLAFADLDEAVPVVRVLPVPQFVDRGTVDRRETLPSFLYLATESEAGAGVYAREDLGDGRRVAGQWARRQSGDVPDRTVSAAKSWLGHRRVDRRAALLPLGASDEVGKVSPVEASRHYLEHLVRAWDRAFPEHPFAGQSVVLTVPASFDESARELTREAALGAGFPEGFVLLEEPQAAIYAWLSDQGDGWRGHLSPGDRVLVCDVGGGTTDFSLIAAEDEGGNLELRRQAVGRHLLVGGDNMDLALAVQAQERLEAKGVRVDAWQSAGLWHACRAAKEALLGADAPERHPVTVLGRGSRLIGGTVSVDLTVDDVSGVLLEGFFGSCGLEDRPGRGAVAGFRELGLPYEPDVSIPRHLAAFLGSQGADAGAGRPTHVLFNGGVFKAGSVRSRLLEILGGWFPDAAPAALEGVSDLDLAVARGAAYYGLAKAGRGVRIRGGVARSYYVGIETSGPAIPGAPRPVRPLCVVPFGMEEGTSVAVPGREVGLVLGDSVRFRFFSATARQDDRVGDLLEPSSLGELEETDAVEAVLPASGDGLDDMVPVTFRSHVNELGVLELWCDEAGGEGCWKLEFAVRESGR